MLRKSKSISKATQLHICDRAQAYIARLGTLCKVVLQHPSLTFKLGYMSLEVCKALNQ